MNLYGDLAGIMNMAAGREDSKEKQEFDLKQIKLVVGLDDFRSTPRRQRRSSKLVGPELNPLSLLFCAIGIKPLKIRHPSP